MIFPFLRAHKRWFAKVKSTPNHLLDELEEQSACDCYIKVKEGYIPAHSILLHKSKVIYILYLYLYLIYIYLFSLGDKAGIQKQHE